MLKIPIFFCCAAMSGGYSVFVTRKVIFKKIIGLYDSKLLFPEPGSFLLACVSLILILWPQNKFLYL